MMSAALWVLTQFFIVRKDPDVSEEHIASIFGVEEYLGVGIATGYGLDGRGFTVRVPVRARIFLFSTSSRRSLTPTQPAIQWIP
jgi:hypothetical protein